MRRRKVGAPSSPMRHHAAMATGKILCSLCVVSATGLLLASPAWAATLTVGPGQTYATPCAAIAAASPGDTVAVSPAPSAYTDSCEVNVASLTIQGVGGQPKVDLSGTQDPADDKGIYVINASNVTIDNMELTGANVDLNNGLNGAALRVQGDGVTVTNCYIHGNQDGILATPAAPGYSLTVEYTQFDGNGLGAGCDNGGCTHNIYLGANNGVVFQTFLFAFNWSHDIASDTADKGHLLKTRAQNNYILYNALLGETGHDSIELDIPNGGLSVVVGNVLEKGPSSDDNPNVLSYGEEGLSNPVAQLYVVNNTFVSDYSSSVTFITVASGGTLTAHNNLFNGAGTPSSTGSLSADNLSPSNPLFADPTTYDFHLQSGSPAIGQGVAPGGAGAFSLTPVFEYVQPIESVPRAMGSTLDVGAFQYGTVLTGAGQTNMIMIDQDGGVPATDAGPATDAASTAGDAGATSSMDSGMSGMAEGGATIGDGGAEPSGSDGGKAAAPTKGGCQCDGGGSSSTSGPLWLASALIIQALVRRRRRTTVALSSRFSGASAEASTATPPPGLGVQRSARGS